MVAGPSHAPEHHEAHGQPAAANTMHFKNGGVLGLTESIAKLVKGITYDAGKDTFGGGHGGHAATHAAPHADAGHGAEAAHATPHADAHGAAAAHAEGSHGHDDDDKDLSDRLVQFLLGAGHYGVALPFIGKGLKWVKEKLFPEIHEITVDYDKIGDQILHKLKKDKKKEKKGEKALDHHALEGFCKGIDVPNLNRQFRLFLDKTRFEKSMQSDAGKAEIQKEIAALLDMTGDVDRSEVEQQTEALLTLLGADTHGHCHHSMDSRVDAKHKALIEIIVNARKWLDQPQLDLAYKGKSDKFEIDYDQFGDVLLEKVNAKNRVAFVKAFNRRTFDDTFRLLVKGPQMKDALKNDPDELKDQIYKLYDYSHKVDDEELTSRFELFFGKPAVAGKKSRRGVVTGAKPSEPGILGEEQDYDPDEEAKKKFREIKAAFEQVKRNIDENGALEKLFRSLNYEQFGKVLEEMDTLDETKLILRGYNDTAFQKAFRPFLNKGDLEDAIADDESRRVLKQKLLSLMNIEVGTVNEKLVGDTLEKYLSKLDPAQMVDPAKTIFETAIGADTSGKLKASHSQLVSNLRTIKTTLLAANENCVSRIFKGNELLPKYEALGKQILDVDDDKLVPLLAKFKELDVKYGLVDNGEIARLSVGTTPFTEAKNQLCGLLGFEMSAPVTVSAAKSRINALVSTLEPDLPRMAKSSSKAYNAAQFLLSKLKTLDDVSLTTLLQ